MDASRFDALTRALTAAGTRRGLLGLIASLPLLGGLAAFLTADDTVADNRRKKRKKPHKRAKRRRQHATKKRHCKAHPRTKICNGKCGKVKNNCGKAINCGSCACDPPCGACHTCDETAYTCVQDATGTLCGQPGQSCQDDGVCSCTAESCPASAPICADTLCVPCESHAECGANTLCLDGECLACDVVAGDDLATAIGAADDGAVLYICPGAYTGDLSIGRDLTLIGAGEGANPGVDTILQGTGATSVIIITANDQDVTLRRLRITGGSASTGGGINHAGRLLTMTACTVHDNAVSGNTFSSYGGGIYNQSGHTANLTACTISDNDCTGDANGGGISNWGTMTLTNCLVSGNTTSASSFGGGGIINVASGDLTLDNTEVRQNHASQGGGLINTIGTMRVTNGSSITLNTAANVPVGRGAGIFSFGDGTFIDDSSITENTVTDSTEPIFFSEGGGIYNSGGTVHLANGASIANNVAQFQPNCGGSSNSYEGEGCAP